MKHIWLGEVTGKFSRPRTSRFLVSLEHDKRRGVLFVYFSSQRPKNRKRPVRERLPLNEALKGSKVTGQCSETSAGSVWTCVWDYYTSLKANGLIVEPLIEIRF